MQRYEPIFFTFGRKLKIQLIWIGRSLIVCKGATWAWAAGLHAVPAMNLFDLLTLTVGTIVVFNWIIEMCTYIFKH